MKSIFDPAVRADIIRRINSLTPGHKALWGKMSVAQVVKHGVLAENKMQGTIRIKRVFIGRLIGPFVMRKILRDETPFTKVRHPVMK